MDKTQSLYDYWVQFISIILGSNSPPILYAFSFVLFIILFFGSFFGIIKLILRVFH